MHWNGLSIGWKIGSAIANKIDCGTWSECTAS